MNTSTARLSWVLRDMMQSTGVWTFDSDDIECLVSHAVSANFYSLEIGGGQSYQIALQQGYNPYNVLRVARQSADKLGGGLAMQVLLRGANQLGFKHYPPAIQKQNIDLLVAAGSTTDKQSALIIRNFDALNDAANLAYSLAYMVQLDQAAAAANDAALAAGRTPEHKRVHVQAALSYVRPVDASDSACYSINYYVNYAKALMAIAAEAGGVLDSLCIKDMSGQLAPDSAKVLVPALKALGLPVYLHCHSTDEAKATATQLVAVEQGIDGIEVAIDPLAGGTSHNDIETLCYAAGITAVPPEAIAALKEQTQRIFGDKLGSRRDLDISLGALKRMVALGIPGGAIPFILNDLHNQVCKMLGVSMAAALDLFKDEVMRVQALLGQVPLVTPTADIIAKQVIASICNQARAAEYQIMDPRFCGLVLGHYGHVINHATSERILPATALVDQVIAYCEAIAKDEDGQRVRAGMVYPEPCVLNEHPTTQVRSDDYELFQDYIAELFRRYPQSCANYGSEAECFVLHVMRPAGKTDRLVTQNILGPTEAQLRFILDSTLHLLPNRDVPESRSREADEATDELLLDALGDYDGIVAAIRDLVLSATHDSVRERLQRTMQRIIEPICEVNADAKANRYYVERRFVSLFASAVFWDLQRVCRRTGGDSRADIGERTAFKLERIISFTLRKRFLAGRGQAKRFLT